MALTPRSRFKYQQALAQQMGQDAASTAPVQSWTQGLARMLQGGLSGYLMNKGQQGEEQLDQARRDTMARALAAGDPTAALGILGENPETADMGAQLGFQKMFAEPKGPIEVGGRLVDPNNFDVLFEPPAEPQKPMTLTPGSVVFDPATNQPIYTAPRAPQAAPSPNLVQVIGPDGQPRYVRSEDAIGMTPYRPPSGPLVTITGPDGQPVMVPREEAVGAAPFVPPKEANPLPTSALKMVNENQEQLSITEGINSELLRFENMIAGGELPLGPIANRQYETQNALGISSPESRNYASFVAMLEKMRNDSLRLNNGVQTEGDAQRAWNELLANISDEKLVAQRLREIQAINDRARNLRELQIDTIYNNFGVPRPGTDAGAPRPVAPTAQRPETVPQELWDEMTPEEQAVFQ